MQQSFSSEENENSGGDDGGAVRPITDQQRDDRLKLLKRGNRAVVKNSKKK